MTDFCDGGNCGCDLARGTSAGELASVDGEYPDPIFAAVSQNANARWLADAAKTAAANRQRNIDLLAGKAQHGR